MQTILGSGGVIGTELAKNLKQYTDRIRLVGRNPGKVNSDDETFVADLTDRRKTSAAVKGSEVVYLTAGLPYKIKAWEELWPKIMMNVIEGCKEHGARLVFFDNVYMYGKVNGPMTEYTPVNPCSRKGEVRMRIAGQLMDEVNNGNLQALIARSADFYGPGAVNTMVHPMVFEKLRYGKKATWVCNDRVKHSMTFTPDAGKATALLGNTETAFGRIWHLPTDKHALTGKEFIEEVAGQYGVEPKYSVMSKTMMKIAGWFNPLARESVEMLYQLEDDYILDSSDFEREFFAATTYQKGIEIIVKANPGKTAS